ncbi:phenylacetate--CoA ligase [Soonwooa sp.]|uniref:phenylacetate--CoA ligase family protein n=1 Tax=Soonwooa sp. TaxID=1938592 RepID=UPI0028A7D31C|nr:phenylacetate--CoA ligase [Soonwooa sp.]
MIFNPNAETLTKDKLRALQTESLQNIVQYVYKNVEFYKSKYDAFGIDISGIRSLEDLQKLPFTKKHDLRDNYPFGLFAVPQEKVARLHCSSGTTGKPTVVGYTKNDIELFSEVVARSLAAAGCEAGMKLQNAYSYGLFTGGLGLHYSAEKLGMNVIPISGGGTERQIMLLQDFQPEAIAATPSYLLSIIEEIKRRNIDIKTLNLKYAILGSEPWSESLRKRIEAGLNVKATNIYGLSEIIGPGVAQESVEERGTGSYIWEDLFYPEIVDEKTGEPVAEGEYGVLVLTTLTKEAMPIIRYWTGDITNLTYEHSKSRTLVKMGPIVGRADDMMIIRGVNFFHTQIADVLEAYDFASANYQIELTRKSAMDSVKVSVEIEDAFLKSCDIFKISDENKSSSEQLLQVKKTLEKKIKDCIGLSMEVCLCNIGDLPRSEGGKLNRIVDNRNI